MTPERKIEPWCATCPPGNVKSEWLCDHCKQLPENDGWCGTPRREANGFECDDFTAGDNHLPLRAMTRNGRTKYDTDKARMVLKEIGKGARLLDAASVAGVCFQYAKKISAFWRKQAGMKLKGIAKYPKKPPQG